MGKLKLVPYGSPAPAPARPKPTDRRYHGSRWRKLREQILRRDGYRCRIVAGCDIRANTCDHVNPVYPGMSDAEFFDPHNLRAGCWPHNRARAFEAAARRRAGEAPARRQQPVSRPQPGSRYFTDDFTRRPSGVITGDYTRRDET